MIEPISNFVETGVEQLVPPLWGLPRIAAYLVALLAPIEAANTDTEFLANTGAPPDELTGELLDFAAGMVGEARGDRSDPELRALVRGRLIANRSTGTRGELVQIAKIVSACDVLTISDGANGVDVRIQGPVTASNASATLRLLTLAKSAGTRVSLNVVGSTSLTLQPTVGTLRGLAPSAYPGGLSYAQTY